MALARNLRTLIVLGTVVSLMVTGAIWAHQAVAQAAPECPPDWPNQQYAGPLREKDHGRIQYQDYHTDSDGERWFVIRASDSNGYTTIRAYPASDDADGGYITGSPDRVCYLIVREPGATFDLDDPRQVLFPRESDEPAESASALGPGETPTPAQPGITPTVPVTEGEEVVLPMLTSLELDGVTVDTDEVIREGLEPEQQVRVTLQVSYPDGGLAYLALVAEDGTELDRVDCTDGMEQECTLTSTITAPSAYSTTLRLVVIAVDDAGTETELATIALTTRARPSSTSTSGSGSGSSGSGGGSSGSGRVRLEIEPPEPLGPFIADIPAVIYPVVGYTGRYRLYFTLPQGPEGMVIDPNSGVVTWTPPEDDEGRSFDVTVAVTDGTLFEEATFEITVMDPQRIRSSLTRSETDGNVLEITDPDTNLEGLSITSPEDEPPITVRTLAELQKIFELAPEENIPEVPDWITPLTDVFVVKGAFETPVELRLPIGELVGELPEGVQFTDVNLYAYAEISEVDGLFWTPVSVGFSFEGTDLDDLAYIVSLEGMQGLAFFGYHVNEPAMPFEATPQNISSILGDGDEGFHASEHRPANIALHYGSLNPNGGANPIDDGLRSIADGDGDPMCASWSVAGSPLCPDPVPVGDIDCKFRDWGQNLNTLLHGGRNDYRCTYKSDPNLEEPDVEILVKGFGEGCRWRDVGGRKNTHTKCPPGHSPHDLVSWLIGAQSALEELELGYDKSFTVSVHPMRLGFTIDHLPLYTSLGVLSPDAIGYVSFLEGYKVLHITDDNTEGYENIKFIAMHEYFHHAQAHNDTVIEDSGNDLFIDTVSQADWLTEGTAQWFASEVYEDLESVFIRGYTTGVRIMEVGLDSRPESKGKKDPAFDKRKNAYQRGLFFKFVSDKCNDFHSNVQALLNDRSDGLGVEDETGIYNLNNVIAESDCDFGNHLDQEGAERSEKIETAITYYHYATQVKNELSLLYETFLRKDFDKRYRSHFNPNTSRSLPASLPEGETLVYRLSFPPFNDPNLPIPFSVPSSGAYSIPIDRSFDDLPNSTVAELVVVPVAGELIVSIVAEARLVSRDDFNAMNTIGPDEDLHAWFSTSDTHSYVISNTTIPPITFTLANPSPDEAVEANVFLRIRNELDVPHPEELVSADLLELSLDRPFLVELYNSTDGPNWIDNRFWLAEDDHMNSFRINTWYGVYTDADRRVTALTLSDNDLRGEIPASLGELDELAWLHLAFNELEGEIPESLGDLASLYALDLRNNELIGSIPASLGKLSSLNWLDLSENELDGPIPTDLETLTELNGLALNENELTGEIPSGLGMLEELETLVLYSNELTGDIPAALGTLTNLWNLALHGNELTGEIPDALGELDNLYHLDLGGNLLTGNIPEALTGLRKLRTLDLGGNNLDGGIPEDFQYLTQLEYLYLERNNLGGNESDTLAVPFEWLAGSGNLLRLDLSYNNFSGDIPQKIYGLRDLQRLDLSNNDFTGQISNDVEKLERLHRLDLSDNDLDGEIPAELAMLSNLERLYLDDNQFDGEIPEELGDLYSLERLYLHENMLAGSIPATLGDLYNLELLYLYDNGLTGSIPPELGELGDQSVLDELRLENNQLSGAIPAELGDLVSLTELILSNNTLSDAIPTALGGITNLELLHLNNNGFTGAIPAELGDLEFLTELDLSHNQLAEAIPADLGDLTRLETLYLNHNALTGMIPTELGSLANLRILHLNSNQLEGGIPTELGQLTNLKELVLDSNLLVSTIPVELANLTRLETLYLNHNALTGMIPTELGSLANLRILHLNSNQLEGGIPTELGQLTNLKELVLDSNLLVSTIPVELANLTNLEVLHLSGNTITGCIPQGLSDIADNDLSQLMLDDCP